MRIYIIPSVFPTEYDPVAGSFILEQAKQLSGLGNEIIVLDASSFGYKNWINAFYANIKENNIDNIKIIESHFTGLMLSRLPHIAMFLYRNRLVQLFDFALYKYGKPDLIYAHFSFTSGFVAVDIANKNNIPCIVQEHASLLLNNKNKYIDKIVKQTIENSYRFFCVSKHLKTALVNKFPELSNKIEVLYNTISEVFVYYKPNYDGRFIFFSAANLVETKGFVFLLHAFFMAFNEHDNVELRIAGDGPLYNTLKDLIIKNRREKQVILLGALNTDDMLKEYISCHAFVLASYKETFGIVYREALLVGRPLVAVRNNGILDSWNDEYGLLVNYNVDDISRTLIAMKNNIQNYNGELISKAVLKDFGSIYFKKKWQEILSELGE